VIDLHCHALPGIDDGPRDHAEALALCRAAAADGVEIIAATPHLRSDHPRVLPEELAERCEKLNALLRAEHVPVHVVPGGEVDLLWAQSASDEELRLVSICQGGSCLLVETPYGALADNFEDFVFRVQVRGYRVLLAHPERNASLRDNPERLAALVSRGVLVQVTAPAFRPGARRQPDQRFALQIARDGLAHVVASDAHRVEGPRPVGLAHAVHKLDKVRPGLGRWMSRDAPAALLSGTAIPPHPARSRPRGLRRRRGDGPGG
jgi:protein-tyrosine phosphatase